MAAELVLSGFHGVVGKDYEELVAVLITMGLSFMFMVAFGAWWQR